MLSSLHKGLPSILYNCNVLWLQSNLLSAIFSIKEDKSFVLIVENTEQTLKDELMTYQIKYRIVVSKARTHAIEGVTFKHFREKKKNALKYGTNKIEEDI
jgi:hypothetical protein